ncbi:MAG: prepilin peptidase [Patescibacteria group bacterium]
MTDSWLIAIALFIIGTSLGSFINVLVLRYSGEGRIFSKKITGRSHCMSCERVLRWHELIPVASFLLQAGKCRTCNAQLSLQYPIVELASGLATCGIWWAVMRHIRFSVLLGEIPLGAVIALAILFGLAALTLIFLSAVDARLTIIPDESNLLIAFLGLCIIGVKYYYGLFGAYSGSFLGHYASIFGFRDSLFLNHLLAAGIGAFFFGAIVLLSRGRAMGMGDAKLAAAGGLLLGWPDVALSFFLAFILGSFFGILTMVLGKNRMKSLVPFGPFIALGMLLVIFFGKEIMSVYFWLFP